MIEKIPATNREAWLALRGKDLTASVIGSLVGVHEYTTAYEQWALHTGRLTKDPEETPAMRRGTLLEKVAIDILRREHPEWQVHHNSDETRIYYRDPKARIGATPDVLIYEKSGKRGVVQVKSVAEMTYKKKWIVDGEPEPPLWIACQVLVEGHLVEADWVAICPLVIGFGIDMPIIEIPKRPAVIDLIYEKAREFWKLVDNNEEMPPDFAKDSSTLDRMFGNDDGSELDLTRLPRAGEIVEEHANLKATAEKLKAGIAALDTELKAILGNHALGRLPDGRVISWKTINRRGYEVKPTTFRQLRYPKED